MKDVLCFAHQRWNAVYQRPQHLMSRFAKAFRLFFVEEPIYNDAVDDYLEIKHDDHQPICIVVPHLKTSHPKEAKERMAALMNRFIYAYSVKQYLCWYYSPMALAFTEHLKPIMTVYDCMDERFAFKDAPSKLGEYEQQLFKKADLIFTAGRTLYAKTKNVHPHAYVFPNSVDKQHFLKARMMPPEPFDQVSIPHPRFGFHGIIDESVDIDLLKKLAALRPQWHFIIIGPVAKINPNILPQADNIHYLGQKSYEELPEYFAGWDIAFMPFVLNDSTRHISPTETSEFLCAGIPVISTPLNNVITPYQDEGLVRIAATPVAFVHIATALLSDRKHQEWVAKVDDFLQNVSWDSTFYEMYKLIHGRIVEKESPKINHNILYDSARGTTVEAL